MDIRLIFLNYLVIVIRCGGTQEDRHAADWKRLFKRVMRRIYGSEGVDSILPRKTSHSRLSGIRTVNRHR